jgi:hypothetical protein
VFATVVMLALAAPASGHERAASHSDTRSELAFLEIADTVETVDAAADTAGEGLPVAWCGIERTTDDVEHAAFATSLPQFKVVYAHPSDRPNRFAQWRDALQANVSLIGRFMGAQSGGRKAPRFDMGTSCGPAYVDLQVVALPSGRAAYVDNFPALQSAVRRRLTHSTGDPRNVMVLADTISSAPVGRWSGLGTSYVDERPGSVNASNRGNIFSALFVPDGEPAPGANPDGWWPEGMLHEMTHNLGAVGDSAPHASGYGHCWDGYDLMCYADGPSPRHAMTYPCARIAGVMTQVYDCGGDDYFNVAPAAGTYLAESWNVFDNAYLGGCAAVAPACGGTGAGTVPAPPVATADPVLQGVARLGSTLAADAGRWINAPASYAFQWERGDGATWAAIPGAVGRTHSAGAADLGRRLRVRVIAQNGDGSTAAYSAPSGPVTGDGGGQGPRAGGRTPARATPTRGRTTLKVAAGRGRGRRLGTVAFAVAAGRLKATPSRLRLARGRYELRLCTTAGATASRPRCVHRRLSVRRAGRRRLPALSVPVPTGSRGRASYTVTAVGRPFAARTARRPTAGVLLRG